MAGRIKYRKVLGSKNPADLLTKAIGSDLARQHMNTLNIRIDSGRAETAPTLDAVESFVQGWYECLNDHSQEEIGEADIGDDVGNGGRRNGGKPQGRGVTFNDQVAFRAIPVEGRGRRTPQRGNRTSAWKSKFVDYFADGVSVDEADNDGHKSCQCVSASERPRWADCEEDIECMECARLWGSSASSQNTSTAEVACESGNNFESTADVDEKDYRRVQAEDRVATEPRSIAALSAERCRKASERREVLRAVDNGQCALIGSARHNDRAVTHGGRGSGILRERHRHTLGYDPQILQAAIGARGVFVAGASVKGADFALRIRRRRSANARSHTHTHMHAQTHAGTQIQACVHTREHMQSARMHSHADATDARIHSYASARTERARTGAARSRSH